MVTLERLNHDITRLADNLVPTDISSGRQLNSLIYAVSQVLPAPAAAPPTVKQPAVRVEEEEEQEQENSGQEQPKQQAPIVEQKKITTPTLSDADVKKLTQALTKNDAFKGEICLGYNGLTDLSGLYISCMLKKNGSITKLDLSGNNLTGKSAVFIGQALMDSKNSSLTSLSFKGNLIGADGARRVLQASQMLPTLKNIDLGVLNQQAFGQVIDKIGANQSLISLQFEEYVKGKKEKWSCDAKSRFIKSLQENRKIRKVNIFSEDSWQDFISQSIDSFVENVAYYIQRNVDEYQQQIQAYLREKTLLPSQMFESFKNFNKQKESHNMKDFKNMPVRQYLQNSFGPKLKDALFELKKLYNRERNKDLQTISKGVVFIAQYLVDNLSDFEKYGIQTEQVEEDELN